MSRELQIQLVQMSFHFSMTMIILIACPSQYILEPTKVMLTQIQSGSFQQPRGVMFTYFVAFVYNTFLYFWDPVVNTPIRMYHIIFGLCIPFLFLIDEMETMLTLMVASFLIDVFHIRYTDFSSSGHSHVLTGMLKLHHVVTLLLLGVSWVFKYMPLGISILFIHDLTDVPMFWVRILRKQKAAEIYTILSALTVIVSWFYFRVYFLLTIILECLDGMKYSQDSLSAITCISGLTVLWVFNVYWTLLVSIKSFRVLLGLSTETNDE